VVPATSAPPPVAASIPAPIAAGEASPLAPAPAPAAPPPTSEAAGLEVVKSPIVGTFYRTPDPNSPPFVEVGSVVAEEDTVCIIEVMKLMNSIRAGCRGRVAELCVDNGGMVEFGQALMVIEPLP